MIFLSLPATQTFRNIHYLLLTLSEAQKVYSDPSIQKSLSLAGLQFDSSYWPSFVSEGSSLCVTQIVSFRKTPQGDFYKPKVGAITSHDQKLKP